MAFTRTQSGLSNLRLFYNARIVIFTEGGDRSYTIYQIADGGCNNQSVDVKFWRYVLERNGFNEAVEFKPIGSKSTAKKICEMILNGKVKNVAVAMDRDLDPLIGNRYESPLILYTKGYSWENDVFKYELTRQQIESMLTLVEIPHEVFSIIDEAYEDFKKVGRHLLRIELIFRGQGLKFVTHLAGERFFNYKKSPFIDRKQIRYLLREKSSQLTRPVNLNISTNGLCPLLNCYGKLMQSLAITIITYVCRKYQGIKGIPKDVITAAMIERYANNLNDTPDEYYRSLVHRLENAI